MYFGVVFGISVIFKRRSVCAEVFCAEAYMRIKAVVAGRRQCDACSVGSRIVFRFNPYAKHND